MKTVGSRAEVWHGTAKKTSGGLFKKDLKKNKRGRIVSKKMSNRAKKEKRLEKAGYKTKKGVFKKFKAKKRGGMNGNNINNNHNNSPSNNENNSIEELIELNSNTDEPEVPAAPVGFFKGKPLGLRNAALKGTAGIQILKMLEPRNAAALAVSGKGPEKEPHSIQKLAKRKLNFEKEKILKRLTKNGTITINEALIEAVENGARYDNLNKKDVKFLVDVGADINTYNKYGRTPLMIAITHRNKKGVKTLIELGADVKKPNKRNTDFPLMQAAYVKRLDIVKILVDAGADVNQTTKHDGTALTAGRRFDIIEFLLEKGADPNKYEESQGQGTALDDAIERDDVPSIEILLSAGANPNLIEKKYGYWENGGDTPLHKAINFSHWKPIDPHVVTMLLDAGAKIDVKGSSWGRDTDLNTGVTPFHYAVGRGDIEIVKIFLDYLSKKPVSERNRLLKKILNMESSSYRNILDFAINNRHSDGLDMLRLILKAGADGRLEEKTINKTIKRLRDPYHSRYVGRVKEILKILRNYRPSNYYKSSNAKGGSKKKRKTTKRKTTKRKTTKRKTTKRKSKK